LDLASNIGNIGDFPNSRNFGRQSFFLPSGPEQPTENVERVLETLSLFGKRTII
jgi:dTDP-4-amino-4,6-dideoxygalactose transaminase